MTQYDNAAEETEDRFYAQFDSREVKLMTLDELVSAFEAGEIHENTFVCREGESEWLTLADVAGLNDSEEEEAQAAPEPVVERRPAMPNRVPEGALATQTRPPMPNRVPEGAIAVGQSRPPMPNRVPEAVGASRPPMPNRRPDVDTIPPSRQVMAIAPSAPLSYAPVTSNIDLSSLDLDDLDLRPKRKTGKIVGGVAAFGVLAAAGAFIATGGLHNFATPSMGDIASASQKSSASLTLSNIQQQPSTPAPVAAPTPAPEPVAAATPAPSDAPSTASPTSNAGFSDDMKTALLNADKERATKHASKVKAHAATASVAHHSGKAAASSGGFKSGGSAYDPLNGKL